MAAAPTRTARHYVSDCLQERYPYDVTKGFGGARAADLGRVFDGYKKCGMDHLVCSLTDASVSMEEKTKALRHLHSRSASQEVKIELLQRKVVPAIVSLLVASPLPDLEYHCYLLLTSLAVLPQSSYPIIRCGALRQALESIAAATRSSTSSTVDCEQCRTAAANTVLQVCNSFPGIRWLLNTADCMEFCMSGDCGPEFADALPPESVISCMVQVLTTARPQSKLGINCMSVVSRMTTLEPGLRAMLHTPNGYPVLAAIPIVAASQHGDSLAFCVQYFSTIWNLAMDQRGLEELDEHGIPDLLFGVFQHLCDNPSGSSSLLQRHLLGAISAVSKLTTVKYKSLDPLGNDPQTVASRFHKMTAYLMAWNDVVDAETKKGELPASPNTMAIVKNTVQCIHLACEVRAVRDAAMALIKEIEMENTTTGFYLRRQLFYRTRWEKEFDAGV